MPDLNFEVTGAEAVTFAAAPLLHFKLAVSNADPDEAIQNVMLRCQVQIETVRRQYSVAEKEKLFELYGEPDRWGKTLQSMLWAHSSAVVQPFSGNTSVNLPVPCTFDFNIASTKYFDGLEDGEIPLLLLFSGTVFYRDASGIMQVEQISWEKESAYRLPVSVWKTMMDHYYPNSAWLTLRKDIFDKLQKYKIGMGLHSWEQVVDSLLYSSSTISPEDRLPVLKISNSVGRRDPGIS